MIRSTKFYSKKINNLAKGCQLCVQGKKLVLFVTGLCSRHCYYCPISDKKYQKDVTYADEWPTKNIKDIIKEAELIRAEGAGFTGGDPLARLSRTIKCIKALKSHFKWFHIHLYTSFDLVTEKTLKKLHNAGLDEIRFHADINNKKEWEKIFIARKFPWKIGIEIPAIPKQFDKIKVLVDFFHDKIDFLNINELEIADNKYNRLLAMGFKVKNSLSYAVNGSEKLADKLLHYINKKYPKMNVHYCTAKLKDKVQMAKRIKRRAISIKHSFEKITKEGTLIHGVIYLKKPSFGYNKTAGKNRTKKIKTLEKIRVLLIKKYKLPKTLIIVDKNKPRILTSVKIIKQLKNQIKALGIVPAITEEYPTYDQTEMDILFI